ncbi:hypothetical protein EVAR_36752_1 [Eumeta japonica]|uniref:Uncharacterized protein n=1 Tax=Eumeta variegata TaxID=151549 RepID=A0A4C1X4B2_EUMVA|nr:hypothetical protein EVAR_36752_1 [Eumeta japonica]
MYSGKLFGKLFRLILPLIHSSFHSPQTQHHLDGWRSTTICFVRHERCPTPSQETANAPATPPETECHGRRWICYKKNRIGDWGISETNRKQQQANYVVYKYLSSALLANNLAKLRVNWSINQAARAAGEFSYYHRINCGFDGDSQLAAVLRLRADPARGRCGTTAVVELHLFYCSNTHIH